MHVNFINQFSVSLILSDGILIFVHHDYLQYRVPKNIADEASHKKPYGCYRKIKSVVIQTEFVSFSSTVTLANRLK